MLLTFYIADNVLYGIKIALQLIDAGAQIKAVQNSLEGNRRPGFYLDKYGIPFFAEKDPNHDAHTTKGYINVF